MVSLLLLLLLLLFLYLAIFLCGSIFVILVLKQVLVSFQGNLKKKYKCKFLI